MNNVTHISAADVMYGQFIKYDRMYEMTKYALYGANTNSVNIYIDAYSLLIKMYRLGSTLQIDDSCSIASSLINLAIHLRAYFESRHRISSKVFIIYGGARPINIMGTMPQYNTKNNLAIDSNTYLTNMIMDNLDIMNILTPYLHEIYSVIDYTNEFSTIVSYLIDNIDRDKGEKRPPNIIYTKDTLAYQLVAFKPFTFLYRPRKSYMSDNSWVVTKSTLYNAYRNGELGLKTVINTDLHVHMFSIYQAVSGVRSRSIQSIISANKTIKKLEGAVANNVFINGYNASALNNTVPNPFEELFRDNPSIDYHEVQERFNIIDLPHQTMIFKSLPEANNVFSNIVDLYNPDEVKSINNKYFQRYPLDLNRV